MAQSFKAFRVTEVAEKKFSAQVSEISIDNLPAGEVLIQVRYSSLNYKDALSATGNKGVTRHYPHTPGIDAAGVVETSADDRFHTGDRVLVTSYDLGMNTDGGFAEYVRVPADWVVPLPAGMTLRESMIYGTAGLTAGLSVHQLIKHDITPDKGPVVVTGASGGVGSMAVAVLGKLGYEVIAVSGKPSFYDQLRALGAAECLDRSELDDQSGRPLLRAKFAGAVDTAGGNMLATILKMLDVNGVATCCGLVQSPKLPTTVFPFILRGVSLIGIDSEKCGLDLRTEIWNHLARDWKVHFPEDLVEEVSLDGLRAKIDQILRGAIAGRVLVRP